MGTESSKSNLSELKQYKKYKPLTSKKRGKIQTYRHKSNLNLIKLFKTYNSNTFNVEPEEIKMMTKRSKSLPKEFFGVSVVGFEEVNPGICSPAYAQMNLCFESRTLNLENLVNEFGKIYNEKQALDLMYFAAKAGSVMQSRLDYFPEVRLKLFCVDAGGLRIENLYLYDEYVEYILQVSPMIF